MKKSKILNCAGKDQDINELLSEAETTETFNVKSSSRQHIAVIGGGMSSEREISIASSNGIIDALLALGYHVSFIDMGMDIAQILYKLKPDIIFNALHGTYGEDGCLAGLLNIMRIPYTGCGIETSAIALNKKRSKEIVDYHGIRIPYGKIVKKSDGIKSDPIKRPYIIKPISEGSSIGVKVVLEDSKYSFSEYEFLHGDEVLVEEFIKGRELQVAVLNGRVKGILEIKLLKDKIFYDYEVKYTKGFADHILPAPVSESIYKNIISISEKSCNILGCISGIARVEFILSPKNELYILEVNTHPGMTPMSICPEILASTGMSYNELVHSILKTANFD